MSMKSLKDIIDNHSLDEQHTGDIFDGNALAGEIGEVCNILKKSVIYDVVEDYKNKVDRETSSGVRLTFKEQLIDELGDSLFYLVRIMERNNITLEQVVEAQKHKLRGKSISVGHTYKK